MKCAGHSNEHDDTVRGRIPYLDMLSDYYMDVYLFIEELYPHFETDLLKVRRQCPVKATADKNALCSCSSG